IANCRGPNGSPAAIGRPQVDSYKLRSNAKVKQCRVGAHPGATSSQKWATMVHADRLRQSLASVPLLHPHLLAQLYHPNQSNISPRLKTIVHHNSWLALTQAQEKLRVSPLRHGVSRGRKSGTLAAWALKPSGN